jgi:hypothetical protein
MRLSTVGSRQDRVDARVLWHRPTEERSPPDQPERRPSLVGCCVPLSERWRKFGGSQRACSQHNPQRSQVLKSYQPPSMLLTLSFCSILKNHAIITKNGADFEIKPGMPGAKTKVNGSPLTGPLTLTHKDRVLFGRTLSHFVS